MLYCKNKNTIVKAMPPIKNPNFWKVSEKKEQTKERKERERGRA